MTERDNTNRIGVNSTNSEPVQTPTQQLSYVSPTEFITLPSEGKFYPNGSPLRGIKDLELRYMTAKEEDLLTSKTLIKKGIAIDRVIESLLVNKSFKVDDLIIGDKNALIIATRKSGYGSEYAATLNCPKCQAKVKFNFNLDEIKNKNLLDLSNSPDIQVKEDTGTFLVKLPKTQASVEIKPLTGKDEKYLTNLLEQRNKDKQPESVSTTQIKMFVVSVNQDSNRSNVDAFINSMPAFDAKFLRNKYKELIPDVDMTQHFECANCQHEEVVEVPLTTEFFWPQ